jgi:hypothetical protein
VAASLDGEPLPVTGGACRIPLRREDGARAVEIVLGAAPEGRA